MTDLHFVKKSALRRARLRKAKAATTVYVMAHIATAVLFVIAFVRV